MKIIEHVIKSIVRLSLIINEMQYGFMPGCGNMDAIFKPKTVDMDVHGNYYMQIIWL